MENKDKKLILWFKDIVKEDVGLVGGKNALLGEVVGRLGEHGIRVPNGRATTAQAYFDFLSTTIISSAHIRIAVL